MFRKKDWLIIAAVLLLAGGGQEEGSNGGQKYGYRSGTEATTSTPKRDSTTCRAGTMTPQRVTSPSLSQASPKSLLLRSRQNGKANLTILGIPYK